MDEYVRSTLQANNQEHPPMRSQIPNVLTLCNLFCGCCALLNTFYWQPVTAAWFTLGSFVFDTLDGMVARALNVHSPMGKELDSLADVVSFGAVPGAMLYMLLSHTAGSVTVIPGFQFSLVNLAALPVFVLSMFSAYRLGKFNLDTRQTSYFIGLSTPGCTMFVLGLTLSVHANRFDFLEILHNQWFIYALTGILSWLLVSEIPMFGMKIKGLSLRKNALILTFLVLFIVLIVLLKELALSAIVLCYIVYSLLQKNKIVNT